jgi:hypothetical protein
MRFNPNVTVRHRGVMEKCTYCVQRINARRQDRGQGRRDARRARRRPSTPSSRPARQACPDLRRSCSAIINDPSTASAVSQGQGRRPGNYRLLEELNVKPRTSYLGKVTQLPTRAWGRNRPCRYRDTSRLVLDETVLRAAPPGRRQSGSWHSDHRPPSAAWSSAPKPSKRLATLAFAMAHLVPDADARRLRRLGSSGIGTGIGVWV